MPKLQRIQTRLVSELDQLLARFNAALHDHSVSDQTSTLISAADVTTFVELVATLQRVEAGTYGVCDHCGDRIGYARLAASPTVVLCLDCAVDHAINPR